jgi:release factor glutamine methyltransferase
MRTLEDALQAGKLILKEKNITDGDLDAWYLMSHYYEITRASYFSEPTKQITEDQYNEYLKLIEKRSLHIPLQYITGEQEFMGLTYHVSEDVLIPRQDTEILVQEVMKVSKDAEVLDLCTGSGCIIISLSKLGDIKSGIGVDISEGALNIARENANRLQADVSFLKSDMFTEVKGQFDIIVSNPPYIPTKDILGLMDEVKEHEPFIALDGKEDGLYFYEIIIKELGHYLKHGGYIFFEIGYNQGDDIKSLLIDAGVKDVEIIKDLAGLDRVVKGRYLKAREPFT